MRITSVESQKKNPKRFNVFLDGQFAFGVDEDLVVDRRLVVGKELNSSDVESLIQETEIGKLMEKMYGLFGRRARSEKEVREYLRNLSFKRKVKGFEEISDLVIDQLIKKLKRKSLLNDSEFAKSWIESRSKKYGKQRIKQELFQKGIDREIIEEVINDTGTGEEQVAQQTIEKKLKSWQNLSDLEFRKKAYEYLLRRGFNYETVREVVENILKNR